MLGKLKRVIKAFVNCFSFIGFLCQRFIYTVLSSLIQKALRFNMPRIAWALFKLSSMVLNSENKAELNKFLLHDVRSLKDPTHKWQEKIQILLKAGFTFADINMIDRPDRLIFFQNTPIYSRLLDHSYTTLLHEAVIDRHKNNCDLTKIEYLLSCGSDIDAVNSVNETPISIAVENFDKELFQLLKAKGAQIPSHIYLKFEFGSQNTSEEQTSAALSLMNYLCSQGITVTLSSEAPEILHTTLSKNKLFSTYQIQQLPYVGGFVDINRMREDNLASNYLFMKKLIGKIEEGIKFTLPGQAWRRILQFIYPNDMNNRSRGFFARIIDRIGNQGLPSLHTSVKFADHQEVKYILSRLTPEERAAALEKTNNDGKPIDCFHLWRGNYEYSRPRARRENEFHTPGYFTSVKMLGLLMDDKLIHAEENKANIRMRSKPQ